MKYYFAKGTVRYNNDWCIIECPMDVVLYYKFWAEKFKGKKITTSLHKPHITVVAGKHNKVSHLPEWGKFQGKKIEFLYESHVYTDSEYYTMGQYFWLRVNAPIIAEIRTGLGLSPEPFHKPHLTVGFCSY